MNRLLSYFHIKKRFYTLEVCSNDSNQQYHLLGIAQNKGELNIIHEQSTKDLKEIKRHIPKQEAVHLIINTSSILLKQLDTDVSSSEGIIQLGFPNLNINDFYYSIVSQTTESFIALARKEYIDELIASLDLDVSSISLSCLSLCHLTPFISNLLVSTSAHQVRFGTNKIMNLNANILDQPAVYKIEGLEVSSRAIVGFSSVIEKVAANDQVLTNLGDLNEGLRKSLREKYFAPRFLKYSLGTLFILLLINFLLFNHYYSGTTKLSEFNQTTDLSKQVLLDLKNEINESEQLAQIIVSKESSRSSMYADEIINITPESIILSEFNYQPLGKKIKDNKPIILKEDLIMISGNTRDAEAFSRWLQLIEDFSWSERVKILSFEDETLSSSVFSIQIDVYDDH
jgi:hypothetical protein